MKKVHLFKKMSHISLAMVFMLLTSVAFSQITIPAGSYIIKMDAATTGVAPLRPYGMIHELVKFYQVPIIWVVRNNKLKDAVDYQINGINYSAGLFVISSDYLTPTVKAAILGWTTGSPASPNGYTRGAVTANIIPSMYTFTGANIKNITAVPYWTLNPTSRDNILALLVNAGIPNSQHNEALPDQLNNCNDIYIMPRATSVPTWSSHGNLLNWNQNLKGAVFIGGRSVSDIENLYNPGNTSQQLNFLAEKTAGPLGENALLNTPKIGSKPYNTNTPIPSPQTGTYTPPSDWVSQYIGVSDDAHKTGPQKITVPVLNGGWRTSTNIICFDPTQADVPSKSPGVASLIAYGRAFGDPNRGLVMYCGGDDPYGIANAEEVAGAKAFFNWSLLAVQDKAIQLGSVTGLPASGFFGGVVTLSVTTTPVSSGPFNYSWTAVRLSDGVAIGTFNPNNSTSASTTTYTAPVVTVPTTIVFTVTVTDACNRQSISAVGNLTVSPVVAADDEKLNAASNLPVTLDVTLNDQAFSPFVLNKSSVSFIVAAGSTGTDTNGDTYIDKVVVPGEGTWTVDIVGNVTFTPLVTFTGNPTPIKYTIKDNDGTGKISNQATITITFAKIISGNVWDDANGNGIKDGVEMLVAPADMGQTLYAVAIKNTGAPTIAAFAVVDATTGYTLYVPANANYIISIVSLATPPVVGASAATITPNYATNWIGVSTNANGTIVIPQSTEDLQILVNALITNKSNQNFGIEQLPNSDDKYVFISKKIYIGNSFILDGRSYTVGQNTNTTIVQFPPLSGSDPEDGLLGGGKSVKIITLPTNATLEYNGALVTAGQVIINYDASLLKLTITSGGGSIISFTYAFLDAAGQVDPTPATYTIEYTFVLPVQLTSFTARGDNGDAILDWSTSSEQNSAGFGVEHSTDGNTWNLLGFVNSKATNGNSNQKLTYQYTDKGLSNGTHFYRLKQTDLNGDFAYSNVAKVDMNTASSSFRVYPNPSSSYIFIEYNGAVKTPVRIIDMSGRLMKSMFTTGVKTRVETSEFPAGTYVISIDGNIRKFTVNR